MNKGEEGMSGRGNEQGRGGYVRERERTNNTTTLEGQDGERDKGKKDREKKGLTS